MQKNIESPPILEPVKVRYISNLYQQVVVRNDRLLRVSTTVIDIAMRKW